LVVKIKFMLMTLIMVSFVLLEVVDFNCYAGSEEAIFLKRLNMISLDSGKIYSFHFSSRRKLKEVRSLSSFIGIKNSDDKLVNIYVDASKIPMGIFEEMEAIQSGMTLNERVTIGYRVYPKLFIFNDQGDYLTVDFKDTPVEIGSN